MTTPLPNSQIRDLEALLHPYANSPALRETGLQIITRGEGVRVFDDSGKPFIEAMSGLWCAGLGFSDQELVDAAKEQMDKLPYYHLFGNKSHEPAVELAEKIKELAPGMARVFYQSSGSEANETQIKMVWYYNNALGRPEKKKIISRKKGYHGVTIVSASMTGLPYNHMDFDLPVDRILHAGTPHHWKEAVAGESELEFSARLAAELEAQIIAEGPDTVAAFIAEPVMGAGGVLVPPQGYFEAIGPVLEKYDILLIADEVICGFGRTGEWFGSQYYDLKPDFMPIAKGMTSGYLPMGGVIVSDRVADTMIEHGGEFFHGYTYSGHPVAAAVGLENLRIMHDEKLIDYVKQEAAPYLQEKIAELAEHRLVGQVRGVGLLGAIELVKDKATRERFPDKGSTGSLCRDFCVSNGLVMRAVGDTMIMSPPLVISKAEIDEMVGKIWTVLDQTAEKLGV